MKNRTLKLTHMSFDEVAGIGYVEGKFKGESVSGISYCHPDDNDFKSEIVGLRLAEARLTLNCIKKMIDTNSLELKGMENSYKIIAGTSGFNEHSRAARALRKNIKRKKELIMGLKETVKVLKEAIQKDIEIRDNTYQRLRKMRSAE